jgi:hypothetical protein
MDEYLYSRTDFFTRLNFLGKSTSIQKQRGEAPSPDLSPPKILTRPMRPGEFEQVDLERELEPHTKRRWRLEDNALAEVRVGNIRHALHTAADLF